MARNSSTLLLALIAVLDGALLHAAERPQPPRADRGEEAQPLAWLKSGDYAALEQYYSERQRSYEAGTLSDQALYASFHRLYEDSLDNEGYFDRWMQSFPTSYAAVLARGAYLYRMAWAVRGDKYLSETSGDRVQSMENWLARSRPDLLASLKLTDKPYLSTLYLLNVAMLDGTASERRNWYEQGTALDPANSLLRYRYMFSLRPRWGGSYRQMEDFLRQCEQQQLSPVLLARLRMLIHADLAEDAMRVGDNQRTFDEWQQVLTQAEAAGEEPGTEALIGYTRAAQDLNRPADAERGIRQLEGRNPDDAWGLARLGWIYVVAHRDAEAWPLLVKAADANDSWAQFVVGHTTYDGEPALKMGPDRAAGLIWIRRSAAQCFPDAVKFLAARGEPQSADCKRRTGANREWWAALLPASGVLLTSLATAWVAVSRRRAQTPERAGRLQHPPSTLILGLLAVGLFLALAALALVYDNGSGGPMISALLAGFGVLGLLLMLEYYRVRHELTADGLDFGRLLGPRGALRWRDVTRITYSRGMRWFRIETGSGEVARISAMLAGLPEFARAVLEQVPSYAIDDRAREVLQACAQGELPRLAT
ncbi:MAG: hypothetical protein ACLPTM_15530 [Steroidobacteraceae bacterium]